MITKLKRSFPSPRLVDFIWTQGICSLPDNSNGMANFISKIANNYGNVYYYHYFYLNIKYLAYDRR